MLRPIFRILMVSLISAALPSPAWSQEKAVDEQPSPWDDVSDFVENSSFVWLDEPDPNSKSFSLREFAAQFEGSILDEERGGFLVHLNAAEVRRRIQELREELKNVSDLPNVRSIEPNAFVYGFASGCGDEGPLPSTQIVPPGVERVNGPIAGSFASRVWIIDSGISDVFDGTELNVNRTDSVECSAAGCNPGNSAKGDKLGHGTMIAGTIGAMDNATGLVGIAPGIELVAVQVIKGRRPLIDLFTAHKAILHVADEVNGAQSGDVVNISWGTDWNPDPDSHARLIEEELKVMAGRGVKIVVAAGNNDVLQGSGYVQTVSPARAGAYRHAISGGAIVTVSAAESRFDSVSAEWTDDFWPYSGFGNGRFDPTQNIYVGPPDFAEPGVGISSLWPAKGSGPGMINTCTGTSFATAHMSGILAAGMPQRDGAAAQDPSARDPVTGQYDTLRLDPIGVH